MSNGERSANIFALVQGTMQLVAMAQQHNAKARELALQEGFTEAELDRLRDDALASIMEPLVDPLDET